MILTLLCARSHDAIETGNIATMQISLYNSAYKLCKSLPLKIFSNEGKRTQRFTFLSFLLILQDEEHTRFSKYSTCGSWRKEETAVQLVLHEG